MRVPSINSIGNKSHPSHVETLDAAEALKAKYNEDTQVLCFGYYPEGDANISTLEYASDDFDLITMAGTSDADVAKVFGVKNQFFFQPNSFFLD